MDLDDFETSCDADLSGAGLGPTLSTSEAIHAFDELWWAPRNRGARWMDLIGDYAGEERFLIDGDALVQRVLDDPLLGLAKTNDTSFQLAHALHSLEKILKNFLDRRAVFDVVFWESNGHMTRARGSDEHATASAALARTLLARHLQHNLRNHVAVHVFSSLEDPVWKFYIVHRKPMFIMTSDGGQASGGDPDAVLAQRHFVFKLLSSGITVSVLRDVEFRQLKIFAFVFEGKRERDPSVHLPATVWESVRHAESAVSRLNTLESLEFGLVPAPGHVDLDGLLRMLLEKLACSVPCDALQQTLVFLFLAHCVLLDGFVPLELRGAPRDSQAADDRISGILARVYAALNDICLHVKTPLPQIDIDGRLFTRLLRFAAGKDAASSILGTAVLQRMSAMWEVTGRPVSSLDWSGLAQLSLSETAPQPPATRSESALLPFDNAVFDAEIGHLHFDASGVMAPAAKDDFVRFNTGTVYRDIHHWHNQLSILPRHQGGESKPVSTAWQRQKELKRAQRFMSRFQKFTESLSGATSTGLQQQIIASVGTSSRALKNAESASSFGSVASSKATSPVISRAGSPIQSRSSAAIVRDAARTAAKAKGKVKPPTKKEALLQKIQADKASVRLSDSQKWWSDQLAHIDSLRSRDRQTYLQSISSNKRISGREADSVCALDFRLYEIHLNVVTWISHSSPDRLDVHDSFAVKVMRQALEAYKMPAHSTATLAALDSVLTSLGFQAYFPTLHAAVSMSDTPDRPLSFKFEKLIKSSKSASAVHKWMRVPDGEPVLWQLRVFGEYMDRMFDSKPDKRVQFAPDAWQRKVLDALDADHSILVVAPTSAGKTFISFYAMEKVLRESDDGILVYVAPTKALVNQIAADVHARFRKSRNGKNFWAIHSRDYRVNDPQTCQILVTVPEILATMLLSPSLAKLWTPRIRRIIMDEIHTIGEQESGPVWEQVLLLAPCPVIGLSATIGRPEEFNAWLASVQHAHGFTHTFVHHKHRYSHLRKQLYLLDGQPPEEFDGLEDYYSSEKIRFLHPMTSIGWGTSDLPPDFALEAGDTLSLYDALIQNKASLPSSVAAALPGLHPVQYFSSNQQQQQFLRQQDILDYESELLTTIRPLFADHLVIPTESALQKVIAHLKDPAIRDAEASRDLNITPSPLEFLANLINLVADLHVAGDLPAILFAFDRQHCEIMARTLLDQLEVAEKRWKATSPVWVQRVRDWEAWQARAKDRERAQLRLEKVKLKKGDERGASDPSQRVADSSWESSFDPDAPLEQFSFSGGNSAYLKSELDEDIKDLRWQSVPEWAIKALQRGIAVHHAGMNKAYRSLIERLFRLRFVRVMISTGTLALGINAPARTSVFCGDSPFLTALMYRQCAGRAGRRGYDLLGRVVFYGLPVDRVGRLVMSRLPALTGNFPLSSTLVLRLFNLLEGSDRAATAVRAVSSVLKLPHVAFGSPIGHEQVLHIVRFSIDYLRRIHLLDGVGRPLNLFGITSRLFYTEPSNLALVVLLQSGLVHRICNQASMTEAKRQFMLLMCHLFGRRNLPPIITRPAKSAGQVVLPPLPSEVEDVLVAHGSVILDTFVSYARTYASHNAVDVLSHAAELPLSARSYAYPGTPASGEFVTSLKDGASECLVRCPFVATSGYNDSFSSVSELTHSARDALHLDTQAIPSMDVFIQQAKTAPAGRMESEKRLNAYLLDFYHHGQVDALVKENGIRRGDIWYSLDDFSLTLRTVQAVLIEMLNAPAQDTASPSHAPAPTTRPQSPRSKPSQDDWDAEPAEDDPAPLTIPHDAQVAPPTPTDAGVDADISDDEDGPLTLGSKPSNLTEEDWKVLEVVSAVVLEFDTAFRKMWA